MKRVLIIEEDGVVTDFYRERLEHAGLAVDAARDIDAAEPILRDRQPDLVLIDSVPIDPLEAIQRIKSNGRHALPVQLLTASPPDLVRKARDAGATVPEGQSGQHQILAQISNQLSIENESTADAREWLSPVIESAPDSVNAMRRALHALVKKPDDRACARDLFREIHLLGERVALVPLGPAGRFILALEMLVYDLCRGEEKSTPSVLRTISQSVDFVATMFSTGNVERFSAFEEPKILAVDDDPDARQMIIAALELVGLRAWPAENGKAALDILAREDFQLIFLDISMPEMSGLDACAEIRKLPAYTKTPVVFVTGMTTFENRAQSTLRGGNDFIAKPFSIRELGVKALALLLRQRI
jgi:DNA-binding response OmpR family regulator